jgi:hypothetical protein
MNIENFAKNAHASTNHLYDDKPYSVHLSMVVNNAIKYLSNTVLIYKLAYLKLINLR